LIVKNKLNKADDKEQLNALKQGFYEILPHNINSFLDGTDLKVNYFLISILIMYLIYTPILNIINNNNN